MALSQSIDDAREERIGRHGVTARALADVLVRTGDALAFIRARHADGSLPLLRLPEKTDDLAGIAAAAKRLVAGANDLAPHIVFLGTGGSSLGGQTVAQLAGCGIPGLGALRTGPRLHFMDNLDPGTYAGLLARLPLAATRFVAVSKSGGTGETLMQTIAALAAVRAAGLAERELFLGITEPAVAGRRNGLRDLLGGLGIAMLDHDPGVGGRYSVLTNVGLLPAAVADLDIAALRRGAAAALAPVLAGAPPNEVPAAVGAALNVALATTKPIAVMMAYADRLERFTRWYVQLWAESLGKDGKGTTPIAALGPVDQHSQLQLFIAGPRDKLFTVITVACAGEGPRLDAGLAAAAGEPGFAGKTIGDLVVAQGRATAETLAKNGCPVRTIKLDRLDEESLGELLMHFMLETIIAAQLLGIDAFDQPAVEEGKVLAKRYLTNGA
jgi:glucose-6-phosphate isomerase